MRVCMHTFHQRSQKFHRKNPKQISINQIMECRNQNCRKNLSIPPNAQIIRCFECQTAYSVANSDNDNNNDDRSDEVINYKGVKDWCQDLENKKQEAKLYFKKKLPLTSCNPQTKNSLPPPISARAQPRGGRRALICGVTYKKKKHELKGTAQDVKNMHNMLRKEYGFSEESILILSEEEEYHDPTKKNIEEGFDWLTRGIQAGDSLLFYFSGHGKRLREFENDENDGFDETICPLDFETSGMIVDNEINKAIVRPLVKGVVLHAIIDSCHSGTVLDLPYVYDIKGREWEDDSPPSGFYKGTKGGKAICFSACEDYQLAADTSALSADKEMTGAMTIAFINAIKDSVRKNYNITYHDIMDSMHNQIKEAGQSGGFFAGIRRIFHRRILQDPQLSSSERFNTETIFKL